MNRLLGLAGWGEGFQSDIVINRHLLRLFGSGILLAFERSLFDEWCFYRLYTGGTKTLETDDERTSIFKRTIFNCRHCSDFESLWKLIQSIWSEMYISCSVSKQIASFSKSLRDVNAHHFNRNKSRFESFFVWSQ